MVSIAFAFRLHLYAQDLLRLSCRSAQKFNEPTELRRERHALATQLIV